ncbi:MAG: thioredoxin [candidate division Zixibacteria bacterium RBG_16_53_22]|nr:MAG: thioredoxin [candidate division Zixibacteria bacterium RBG_16_53_22]
MSKVIEIDEANFENEVAKSDIPVMIDFWATWCGPCRMIAPHVEEASNLYSGKLKVGKVDVDNNHRIASQYSIMSIPAVMFFKNGMVVDQIIGAVPRKTLFDRIEKILLS